MSLVGTLAGVAGVGGVTAGGLVAAWWVLRVVRAGARLATVGLFAAVLLVAFSVGTAAGYVDGGRLLADLWGVLRALAAAAIPVARSLLAG